MTTIANEVATWAHRLITEATAEYGQPLARYGSPEWARMPHRQRWAAILIAAECWRIETDPGHLALILAAELDQARTTGKQLEDAEYLDRMRTHRTQWAWLTHRNTRGRPLAEVVDDIDDPEPPTGPIRADEVA